MNLARILPLIVARVWAVYGPCRHRRAVPVDTLLGEHVAWLCPACDRRLPQGWRRRHSRQLRRHVVARMPAVH